MVEVRPEAQAALTAEAERRSADTVWLKGGCRSYYQTPDGKRNAGLWPSWSVAFRRRTRALRRGGLRARGVARRAFGRARGVTPHSMVA